MDRAHIEALLNEVREGRTAVNDALDRLRDLPFEDLGFAKLDHHRALRTGMPEVIFAAGKTAAQVAQSLPAWRRLEAMCWPRAPPREMFRAVRAVEPRAEFHETARAITLTQAPATPGKGTIAVVCAGTSDLPVAEEAVVTARLMGNTVELIADVGVAGIHRLLAQKASLAIRARADRLRRHGGRAAHRRRRPGERAGARRSHQRGLWRVVRRRGRAAGHAEYLLAQCLGGQYRQRLRRGLHRFAHQSAVIVRL